MTAFLAYLKGRLNERSTYMLMVAGVAGGAALPKPWDYLAVAIGIVAALVPDGAVKS